MKIRLFAIGSLILTIGHAEQFMASAAPANVVIGWGENGFGEATGVPTGPSSCATGVVMIAGQPLTDVMAISASDALGFALKAKGPAVGWGNNFQGRAVGSYKSGSQFASGSVVIGDRVVDNLIYVAGGRGFGLGLNWNGEVVAWGENAIPNGLSNIRAIAAHEANVLAVKRDGRVVGWSTAAWNSKHHYPRILPGLSNVVTVAVGGSEQLPWHTALKKDGTIVVWRSDSSEAEAVPSICTNVVAIAAGTMHTLALRKDGAVVGFGYDKDGQATGIPTNQSANESYLTSGLVSIGRQILTNAVAVAAHGNYSMALKRDGKVIMWGDHNQYKDVPAGLTNVTAIAAGDGFCLAVTTSSAAFEKK